MIDTLSSTVVEVVRSFTNLISGVFDGVFGAVDTLSSNVF